LKKLKQGTSECERFITDKFKDFTIVSDIIVLDEEDEKEEIDEYPPITKQHHNLLRHALAGRKDEVRILLRAMLNPQISKKKIQKAQRTA
jgi:hypothetical protein